MILLISCFIIVTFFSRSTAIESKTKVLGQREKRNKYHKLMRLRVVFLEENILVQTQIPRI